MRRGALISAAVVALAALACRPGGPAAEPAPPPAPRVAFFGSSTVAGSGASSPERRWTTLAARELGWTELNLGLPGSRLADGGAGPSAERRWRNEVLAARPDAVVLMYGANDLVARVPLGAPGEPGTFRNAAEVVLGGLRAALPGALLVVCVPQPIPGTEDRRAPYDAALGEAAAAHGAVLVETGRVFPLSRWPEVGADAIHLNDRGHAEVATLFVRTVAPSPLGRRSGLPTRGSALLGP